MTKTVSGLDWQPITNNNAEYAAVVPVDTNVDNTWVLNVKGGVDGQPQDIRPTSVTIDNFANATNATFLYGPYVRQVPAYSRKTFGVPENINSVTVNGTTGTIIVSLQTSLSFSPDDADLLKVQEAALGINKFPFIYYTATNQPQQITDFGEQIGFIHTSGGNMNYTLLPIAATPVENGAFLFLYNFGDDPVNIVPSGADDINGVFLLGSPLVMYHGDVVFLTSSGSQWFATFWKRGEYMQKTIAANINATPNDFARGYEFASTTISSILNLPDRSKGVNGDWIDLVVSGTQPAQIKPQGSDIINGFWINSKPLIMRPGDHGRLYIDGDGFWRFTGVLTYESPEIVLKDGNSGTFPHNLSVKPTQVGFWFRCIGNEAPFVAGMEFESIVTRDSSSGVQLHYVGSDNVNVVFSVSKKGNVRFTDFTTGDLFYPAYAGGPPTFATNFVVFIRAKAEL